FSSRRRHTRSKRDWSSDVCSSDLAYAQAFAEVKALGRIDSPTRTADQTQIANFWADGAGTATPPGHWNVIAQDVARARGTTLARSEERRVGKEGRARGAPSYARKR